MDRERFGKYFIIENLNRILWSTMAFIKLLSTRSYRFEFTVILLVGILHIMLSLFIVFWRKIGNRLFFSFPFFVSLVDILYMTFVIYSTGMEDSHMYLLYAFPITIWALRYGIKGALTITPIISVLYAALYYIGLGHVPSNIMMRISLLLYFSLYTGLLCQKTQNKIYNMATHDGLTSLYNQKYFFDNLNYVLERASKANRPVALALLDLDDFKKHNDLLGHLKGDELLQKVSAIIKSNIRSTDIAARYGGDEFVIIFPNTDSQAAINISERIRRSIENEIGLPNTASLSVSIGIGVYPKDGTSTEELFNAADKSLYLAKNQGKNTVVYQPFSVNASASNA